MTQKVEELTHPLTTGPLQKDWKKNDAILSYPLSKNRCWGFKTMQFCPQKGQNNVILFSESGFWIPKLPAPPFLPFNLKMPKPPGQCVIHIEEDKRKSNYNSQQIVRKLWKNSDRFEFGPGICICMLELLTISYFVLETLNLYLLWCFILCLELILLICFYLLDWNFRWYLIISNCYIWLYLRQNMFLIESGSSP